MIAKDGRILKGYYCAKNSPAEVQTIIEMGIKRGVCSLKQVDDVDRIERNQLGRNSKHSV
jgi:hypothetical protein